MFFFHGAQGPSKGPTCVDVQGDEIFGAIRKMRLEDVSSIEKTRESEEEWRRKVAELNGKTPFPRTNTWCMGANIPGQPREQLNYAGGFPLYQKEFKESLGENFKGFLVITGTA